MGEEARAQFSRRASLGSTFSSSYTSWTKPVVGRQQSDSCVPASSILDMWRKMGEVGEVFGWLSTIDKGTGRRTQARTSVRSMTSSSTSSKTLSSPMTTRRATAREAPGLLCRLTWPTAVWNPRIEVNLPSQILSLKAEGPLFQCIYCLFIFVRLGYIYNIRP